MVGWVPPSLVSPTFSYRGSYWCASCLTFRVYVQLLCRNNTINPPKTTQITKQQTRRRFSCHKLSGGSSPFAFYPSADLPVDNRPPFGPFRNPHPTPRPPPRGSRGTLQLNHHSQGEINLISYDDAASAVVAALRSGLTEIRGEEGAPQVRGQIFLAAGDEPITRQKICEVALAHPLYSRKKMPKFWGDDTPKEFAVTGPAKVYDSTVTRRTLGWEPRASSMEEYFEQEGLSEGEVKLE